MPPSMTEEDRFARRKENLEAIQRFRLMDNPFMGRVFQGDIELGQLVATVMTGRDDIAVSSVITEHTLPNLRGRSVRLDIHASDHGQRDIDIEIQRDEKGATPKRIRFISAMLDANFLIQREDFGDLPEQYIFFVTEYDVTGLHRLYVPIERRMGNGWVLPFRDDTHAAYIDSSQADDSPLGRLMHDFRCNRAEDMCYPLLRERVHYYKETKEGVTIMSDYYEELRKKDREEGEGNIILNMLKEHMHLDAIEHFSGWTADKIRALAEKNGLAVE